MCDVWVAEPSGFKTRGGERSCPLDRPGRLVPDVRGRPLAHSHGQLHFGPALRDKPRGDSD